MKLPLQVKVRKYYILGEIQDITYGVTTLFFQKCKVFTFQKGVSDNI